MTAPQVIYISFCFTPELLCDAQTLEPTGGHRDHKVTAVLRRTVCGPNLVGGRSGQWLLITAAIPGQTDWPRRQTGRAKKTEYLSRLTRHSLGRPFINVASDSSPGSDDALPAQTRRGCVLLQPGRLRCSAAAACWPISALGQGQLFALQPASTSFG